MGRGGGEKALSKQNVWVSDVKSATISITKGARDSETK